MALTVQLVFLLLSLASISGSSDVFGQVDRSVQLDIPGPVPEFKDLYWVFNGTKIVLKYNKKYKDVTLFRYKDRVEFNEGTYSLTLKNLQKTDSGLYVARASGDVDTVVAEYRLSVLDPVKAPGLTPVQIGRDPCNITLTCGGYGFSLNSSCSKETCEEKNKTAPGGVTLSLSVNRSSIICNQSNPVSWQKAVLEIVELEQLCADKKGPNPPDWLWLVVGILVGIILIVIILIIYLKNHQKKSTGAIALTENTVYAEVQHNSDAPQTVMMEHPTTVYSVVGKQQPAPSNEQSGPSPVSEETLPSGQSGVSNTYESVPSEMSSTKPETIYATVSKGIKSS